MGIIPHLLTRTGIVWRSWSMAALMEARDQELPVLVLAYEPTDHWAARWVRELAGDRELIAVINELFLPVAASVPEHPALSGRMQQVAALTADASGWPLMAVLTDQGRPFGASAWRPLRDQGPTPGLARMLIEVATAWKQERSGCLSDASQVARIANELLQPPDGRLPSPELLLDGAEASAMALANPLEGGFGPAPRRLEPALWSLLIARCDRIDAPLALSQQMERTLTALIAGAGHDHLSGGFFHGCVDRAWRQPFFDKRLRDQALMATVLFSAARVLDRPVLAETGLRALAWALATFARPDGLFAHGLCADSVCLDSQIKEGVWREGGHYRWQLAEVAEVIGSAGAALVAKRFGLTADGNLEEADDNVFTFGELLTAENAAQLPTLIARLAMARAERKPPPMVESAFCCEQGMLLFALHQVDNPPPAVIKAADHLARALAARQAQGPLPARWDRAGHAVHAASGSDLSWVARGFLAHAEATRQEHWRDRGLGLLGQAMDACDTHGRVLLNGDPAIEPPVPGDADSPGDLGPAAVLGHAAIEAHRASGDATWRVVAEQVVEAHRDRLRFAPLACAGILEVLDRLQRE